MGGRRLDRGPNPRRFGRSKTVGAYLGLTSRRWQSGTSIDVRGRISKACDGEVRHPLYEAANIMLTRYRGFSSLKAWELKIARKHGHQKACVAVARRLAVHAMWRDGTEFRFTEGKESTIPRRRGLSDYAHRGGGVTGKRSTRRMRGQDGSAVKEFVVR